MGSPSSRLNLRENLRPWLESGLEFVYAPGGLTVEAHSAPDQARTASPRPQQSQPQPAQPTQPQPTQQQPSPMRQAPSASPRQGASPQPPSPRPAEQPNPNFPAPWASFLRFTKPGARVVMTYMELGLDLSGQPDPRRRGVLKNLQAHLKWPAGTINFWPVAGLVNGALEPDTAMFWRGWELWRTPHIVCFGDEALRVVLPDADPAIVTHLLENVIVHKLPPLSRMVDMLPHEQQLAADAIAGIRL